MTTRKTALWTGIALLTIVAVFGLAHAQRPPERDEEGVLYLRTNINPTDTPPMVNINPFGAPAKVQVTEMPELRISAGGCANRTSYVTGVGRRVDGPLMITYLHLPEETRVTLGDPSGSHSMNMGSAGQIRTALFLQTNQTLSFDADVMFSGCRPE
jgi:hypothetical protein